MAATVEHLRDQRQHMVKTKVRKEVYTLRLHGDLVSILIINCLGCDVIVMS